MHELRPLRMVAVVAIAILAPACAGGTSHESSTATSASNARPAVSSSGTTAPPVPNPFTVIARLSASSLGLDRPANLAIGPDGNLYVTDASQHVTVISPGGKVLRRWGGSGKGPGQFDFVGPSGPGHGPAVVAPIAVGADGHVYVVDSGNVRVEVFFSTGAFLRQFGSNGTGNGQFLFPSFLAVDSNGDAYVADDQALFLTKFSPVGKFEWRIGGSEASDPDLIGHLHLATVDSHGRIVTANDDENRVLYVNARGNKVDAFLPGSPWDSSEGACDVTVDGAGYTFVNSCEEPLTSPHYTGVFDRDHHLVGAWYPSEISWSPRFGPNGEVFTLGDDGSILELKVALPNA